MKKQNKKYVEKEYNKKNKIQEQIKYEQKKQKDKLKYLHKDKIKYQEKVQPKYIQKLQTQLQEKYQLKQWPKQQINYNIKQQKIYGYKQRQTTYDYKQQKVQKVIYKQRQVKQEQQQLNKQLRYKEKEDIKYQQKYQQIEEQKVIKYKEKGNEQYNTKVNKIQVIQQKKYKEKGNEQQDKKINKIQVIQQKKYKEKGNEQQDKKINKIQVIQQKIMYQQKKSFNLSKIQQPLEDQKIRKRQFKQYNFEIVGDLIDYVQERKLKKYLVQIYKQVNKITIKYDKTMPNIVFQFKNKGIKQIMTVVDLIKVNQNIKKNKKLIHQVYSSIYKKLDKNYYQIGYMGIQIAKNSRIFFLDRNFRYKSLRQKILQYPLYYAYVQQEINFVMFDFALNCVDFSSESIISLQKSYLQQAFQKYKLFQKQIFKYSKIQDKMNTNLGQEQIDSDQEERAKKIQKQKDFNISEIRQKIKRLLKRDISEFQQKIDEKDQQIRSQNKIYNDSIKNKIEKLAEQVMEEQASLDNFTQTRDQVKLKIKGSFSNEQQQIKILKSCLKRMILAEKQLTSRLPIISRKRQIFQKLNKSNLLILQGQTGSGKSTQLPQMLCEYYKIFENDVSLPVLITQPRRLATRSLAQRVALEMEEKIHGFVDYQTSLTTKISQKAKIVFKMDRLVLDQLRIDPKLSKYCCLVVDQAHQRTISIDLILGLIKNLLILRKDFKIIVTSASMDTDLLKQYYQTQILKVSGRMFPVEQIFEPYNYQKDTVSKIKRVINQKLLDENEKNLRPQYRGHVLAFCSGVDQINQLTTFFSKKLNPVLFQVHALHGRLNPQEQRKVFIDTNKYKIIFTTRIAQTSITIDKVRVVIDPGEDREMIYDQKTKVTALKLKNISQSSAKQRAGRAGRTNQGYCFRLYSRSDKNKLMKNKIPQILNMALDTVVLRLKSLEINDIINFPYLSKPDKEGLQNSIQLMKMLNCLDPKTEKITTIGDFLVKIPIQPFLARAIVEAMLLQSVINKKKHITKNFKIRGVDFKSQIIRILCLVVNASNIFYIHTQDREKAQELKFRKWADQDGDFFFLKKIYQKYIDYYKNKNVNEMRRWANDHYLSLKTLHQVRELQMQISQIIKQFIIFHEILQKQLIEVESKLISAQSQSQLILSCLVSSFATNLALYSENQQIGYTIISTEKTMKLYGTSTLSLQGISPKWILFYDLYQNEKNQLYCKIAHAVDFNFLKHNTNKYILNKFKILDAEKKNPYYEKIVKKVPTLVFMNVMDDYHRKDFNNGNKLSFLKNYIINFNIDINSIEFYYRKDSNSTFSNFTNYLSTNLINRMFIFSNFRQSKDHKQIIQGYLKQIQINFNKPLKHNYIGQIYINLEKGFNLANIDFRVTEHVYKVYAGKYTQIVYSYCHFFGTCEIYNEQMIFKINEEKDRVTFENILKNLIQNLKHIKYEYIVQDRLKKVPQIKLFLRFWAGSSQKNNFLLDYNGNPNLYDQNWIKQMVQCLNSERLRSLGHRNKLSSINFSVTKQQTGINCNYSRGYMGEFMDQFELHEIMQQYQKQKLFGYNFEMPQNIRMFRQPDLILASRRQKQWQSDIEKLLVKKGINIEKTSIKAWGKPFYKSGGQFQQSLKVQWQAEIKSYDLKLLQQFKQAYDKKHGIIGTQKLHVNFQYQYIPVVASQKVFQALKIQFDKLVQYIQDLNPSVTVQYFHKIFKNKKKVYIKVRGKIREQLIQPSLTLQNLFTPSLVPLQQQYFRFIQMDEGYQVLNEIEEQYGYSIYFLFNKKESLKIYRSNFQLQQIIQKLNNKMKQFKIFSQEIQYRGLNLNKVKDIIDRKIKQIKNAKDHQYFLKYEILFKFRKVCLMGDIDSYNEVKNQIMKLINKQKPSCTICNCSVMQKQYRLYGCEHQFCWTCLSLYIRQNIYIQKNVQLVCPFAGCSQLISVYDVQKVMSQQQFNKLCETRIKKCLQTNKMYHQCFSQGCQNLFLTNQLQNAKCFECEVCGKWYCFLCRRSHQGYSCKAWNLRRRRYDDGDN